MSERGKNGRPRASALALGVLALAAWGSMLAASPARAAGAGAAAASNPTSGARLGVEVVPAPAVPGARVRTTGRIEVLAAAQVQGAGGATAVATDAASARVADRQIEGWIGVLPRDQALADGVRREALAWSASPMAILRSDTTLHDWRSLAGHTVCLSADGRLSGELTERFGAIEQVYPSVTDALLGLRTGQCDALVQDEDFLLQLLKFPEWRKFSARLTPYRQVRLERLVRDDLPLARRQALVDATAPERLAALARQQARDIAFEVYLDQTVPDCH